MPSRYKHLFVQFAVLLLALLIHSSLLKGQTKQLLTWREELASIQALPSNEILAQRDAVLQVRTGVEFWLRLHPNSAIKLAAAPVQPWNSEQVQAQVAALREAVDAIIKEDPGQSFQLGATEISVTAETSPLSPVTDRVDHNDIQDYHLTNVAQSIQFIPGVSVDHKSARNQAGIRLRGFDTRQVGIYLDGVPIYVPYDGYADVARFMTTDIAEIEIAKGYSSPLLGPNGLGGSVNMITRQPEKKLEGDATIGTGSGRMLESGMHLGSRWNKFFIRGGMDWLESNYFPLSGNFVLNATQPNYNRVNSYSRDVRYTGRAGWTPKGEDQYVFTYTKQKADYAAPPYSGNDTKSNRIRYWQWPYWNRESYYFNSNTGLGEASAIKLRLFYDKYPNSLNQFSNGYSVLSSSSKYDDYSAGTSAEFANRTFARHALGASFFFKDDTHKETGTSYSSAGVPTYQPWRTQRDQQFSIGVQDSITISARMRATAGFSTDNLSGKKAQNLVTTTIGTGKNATTVYSLEPFPCNGVASDSFSKCLLNAWTFNPLASLSYSFPNSGTLFFTFAVKSQFPTLKDRYSYKNGQAIPNPNVQPEHSRNWSVGYSQALAYNTLVQLDLYRSDVYDSIQNATIPAEVPNQCPTLPAGTCQQSVNIAKEVHQGVEFTIRSTPMSRFTIDANYTFLNRTMDGPVNMLGVYPTATPKHRAIGTASVLLPRRIQLLATARYESGTITTNDSGLVIPASKFATADFGGIVPICAGLDLRAGVKNLFDRDYYYQEGFPEAGRNWYMNLRYRF